MGRAFYSADQLGYPFEHVREICFVFADNKLHRQRSRLPKLILFLEGRGRVEAGPDFKHPIEPGDLLILPTPCYHHYQSSERRDARFYAFTMFFQLSAATRAASGKRSGPERELQEIVRNLLSEKRHLPKAMTPAVSSLIAAFRQEQDEGFPGWKVRLQIIAYSLLVELWRQISVQKRNAPPRLRNKTYVINEVKELLMKSRESQITLAQIAWHVQWSEEHLARAFKKETGMTVMDYLRAIRIDSARMQLLGSSQTVSSIASGLGFESISGFCRAFKTVVGQTPSQYRENHAGEGL
jgi:AraC-like DNA-binding protein